MRLSSGLSLLLAVAVSLVSAEHLAVKNLHSGTLRSVRNANSSNFLAERNGGSRFTYYQVIMWPGTIPTWANCVHAQDGLGACGQTNQASDFVGYHFSLFGSAYWFVPIDRRTEFRCEYICYVIRWPAQFVFNNSNLTEALTALRWSLSQLVRTYDRCATLYIICWLLSWRWQD